MKQSTTQNLSRTKSLRQEFVFRIVAVTIVISFLTVGGVLFVYQYNNQLKNVSRNDAVQKIILNNLVASAKYGDVIYSRAEAMELGKELGLIDLGICLQDRDIFERVNDPRCKNTLNNNQVKNRTLVELGNEKYEVEFTWAKDEFSFSRAIFVSLIASLGISLLIVFPAFYYLFKKFHSKVQEVILTILNRHVSESSIETSLLNIEIPLEFQDLDQIIEAKNKELRKITSDKVYYDLAKKVSHDIRSPLLVLSRFAQNNFNNKTEDDLVFNHALYRINSIAEDLLREKKTLYCEDLKSVKDLIILTRSLMNEKEIEFGLKSLSLELRLDKDIVENLSKIKMDTVVFTRILSNLINNSKDAILEKKTKTGKIVITPKIVLPYFCIEIVDDGVGISESALANYKESKYGISSKGGNGIGLSSAVEYLKRQGGFLEINSELGKGCVINLYFALNELLEDSHHNEEDKKDFILIDDEQINHLMWKKDARKNGLIGSYFKKVEDCLKENDKNKDLPVFVDFYLDGKNGLEEAKLLAEHGYKRIYLCTSVQFCKDDLPEYIIRVVGKEFPSSILKG